MQAKLIQIISTTIYEDCDKEMILLQGRKALFNGLSPPEGGTSNLGAGKQIPQLGCEVARHHLISDHSAKHRGKLLFLFNNYNESISKSMSYLSSDSSVERMLTQRHPHFSSKVSHRAIEVSRTSEVHNGTCIFTIWHDYDIQTAMLERRKHKEKKKS